MSTVTNMYDFENPVGCSKIFPMNIVQHLTALYWVCLLFFYKHSTPLELQVILKFQRLQVTGNEERLLYAHGSLLSAIKPLRILANFVDKS